MKRFIALLVVIFAVMALTACGSAATAVPTEQLVQTEAAVTPQPTQEAAAQPTDNATQAASAQPAEAAYPTPNPNPTCVAAPIPTVPDLPEVTEDDWVRGPENAKITLIEYADFQCPYCAVVTADLAALTDPISGTVRHVYRHFPLVSIHDKALVTAEASEAAGAQGKFWEMYDMIYANQADWSEKLAEDMPTILSGYAEEIGLDVKKFDADIAAKTYEETVMADEKDAERMGLTGTPTFIGEGVPYPSQIGFSPEAIDLFLKVVDIKGLQFAEPPAQVIENGKQYQATIKTEKGDIVLDLYADQAPVTVNNFVFLARSGWYDNTAFHRVISGFMAQAGDPTGTGMAWPGYHCSDELVQDLAYDGPGILGMANSGPDTNGSQYFITTSAQPSLNGKHTIFGKVVSGQDVVESLSERDPQTAGADEPGDKIISVTISEK